MTFSALLPQRLCGIFLTALSVSLLGCSANVPSNSSRAGGQLRGSIHGGQQPISGSSLQLYAAATTGYGAAATALLSSPVVSDANGGFTITGDYTCPSSTSQLYIVATGGNPGLAPGTNNAAIALMAALGPCSLHGGEYTLDPNSFILINEVTTVASVYALAAFMGSDATHLGTSSTNATGLANSFSLVNNLVNVTTGTALAMTPAGNGTAPQATINALGNVMAACVNSDGTGTACAALAAAATPSGGTAPTDTIQGILNVARNPAHNVSALYGLASATPPFQPSLAAVPNDWVLSVTYTAGGLGGIANALFTTQRIAIDSLGNVWIPNWVSAGQDNVVELSSNGTVLSGSGGYTSGGLTAPTSIAIDAEGNGWVPGSGNVVKFSNSGTVLSGANGFTGGGLNQPVAIALDGQGNAWVSDQGSKSVIKLDNHGGILSGASGFQIGRTGNPEGVAIDRAGNAWVGNNDTTVTEFSSNGTLLSGSTGYPINGYAGLNTLGIAIDASGNAWLNTWENIPIFELSPSGVPLSPSGGHSNCSPPGPQTRGLQYYVDCYYPVPNVFALDGAGNVWGVVEFQWNPVSHPPTPLYSCAVVEMTNTGTIVSGPLGYTGSASLGFGNSGRVQGIAIDGGGNVWMMLSNNAVAEFVGAATPVVTPFSLGVKNGTLGSRP
ncbi:MAG TPA: NHL repeat-containing protein [Edaphobacter sp.]|nr:NHL repeat-containing protein [Edaphobacter sp.]